MFSIGMVIYLLSGGPAMTVNAVHGSDITADWFAGNTFQTHTFAAGELTTSDPTPAIQFSFQEKATALSAANASPAGVATVAP